MSSLTLGDAPRSNIAPAPAGNHLALCYAIIDQGTHTEDGAFGVKTNRKIRISWELVQELHTFREEKGPEPFTLHKNFNFTVSEKAALRISLESWRGRPFTVEELKTFDLKKLLGVFCMLNVVHETKQDRTYANIEAITPVPKLMKDQLAQFPPHNPPVFFTVKDGENAIFQSLPEFLQKYIKECAEWNLKPADSNNGLDASGGVKDEEDSDF